MGPYQDKPLARPRPRREDGDEASREEEDPEGLAVAKLESRYEKTSPVEQWRECTSCKDNLLQGAREYRCCKEIPAAYGNMVFDGSSERLSCITQHEDYLAITNSAVLSQTGPLLKGKDGKPYIQRSRQSKNEYLRAVAYRWVIRYIFGYLGWDNARPLPACVYTNIRDKYHRNQFVGFASSVDRD